MASFEAQSRTLAHHRGRVLGRVSIAAIVVVMGSLMASGAQAQTAPSPNPSEQATDPVAAPASGPAVADPQAASPVDATAPRDNSDIVVTSSRITANGFKAPTPTTVLGAKELEAQAQPNLVNTLADLPSMNAITTQKAVGSSTTVSGSTLNPRNLGQNRVLVLMDGQRLVGSGLDGSVDISQLPQQLVKRVDVVTGGASASWGSNAVSGVVNFILDNKFVGFKANINGGITTFGDDPTGQIQLAAGTELFGGRGHLVISGDFTYDAGIHNDGNRPWYTAEKVIPRAISATPAGEPQYIRSKNVYEDQLSPGGIITAGPLKGIYFGPGGTPANFTYGSTVSDPFMIGGTPVDLGEEYDIAAKYRRGNIYERFTYDLSPTTSIWFSGMYSAITAKVSTPVPFYTGSLTIQCDNAFLPAQITAACASNGITNFKFGTSNGDLPEQYNISSRHMTRFAVGGDGSFNLLGTKWTWQASGEYSQNAVINRAPNSVLTTLYNYAIDAVRGPNGQIVCRSAAAQAAGCIPLNIIGTGVANPQAINWVEGNGAEPYRKIIQTQSDAAVSFNGQPFSTWAGPVSIATGLEYRREAYKTTVVDSYSVGNGGNPVLSSAGTNWTASFARGHGSYRVGEAFLEAGVPIIDSEIFGKAALNLAVREEDFSTAGTVTTWKVGATYETPLKGLRFRGLLSRDIRAPGLDELFAPVTVGSNTVVDAGKTFTVANTQTGNTNLKAEKSDNTQFGAVYQPTWFRGLSASVDYWRISIKGGITALTPQQTIDVCAAGNNQVCDNITRNGAGVITNITTQVFNLASVKTAGIDFELGYTRSLSELLPSSWVPESGGSLSIRVLATHVLKFDIDSGIVGLPVQHTVGQLQQAQSDTTTERWRLLGTQSLDVGKWGLTLTERWTSSAVLNNTFIECTSNCPVSTAAAPTINDNHVPSTFYLDVGGRYAVTSNVDAYFKVDNVANADPRLAPVFNGRTNVNQDGATGELLGRTFLIGARLKY